MMELTCTVSIETHNNMGLIACGKRMTYNNCLLQLLRNEFKDLILTVRSVKFTAVYNVSGENVKVHKRFVKDGKGSICLPDYKILVLLSNAPPSQLMAFVRMLQAKRANPNKENVDPKKRLLCDRSKVLEEISPLTEKDLSVLYARNTQNQNKTPIKGSCKRRCENMTPTVPKSEGKKQRIQRILNPTQLTHEQKQVLNAVLSGKNVFFTGSAGTGKSHLLKHIIRALPPETTFATASTGVAACHIGGITLHAFAGIGSGKERVEQCIQQAMRKRVAHHWRKCACLVIDEISMVDKVFFEKLERVAREVRNNSKPFGGIQLVLCGDFFQLPPVAQENQPVNFCFQSSVWERCIQLNMELTEVMRQRDSKFIHVLQEIRLGRCSDNVTEVLKSTSSNKVEKNGVEATQLCTHKEHVDFINDARLADLPGTTVTFQAVDSEPSLSQFMNKHTPVAPKLVLKVGAQVMLTKNIDIQRGLVNGSRGVIERFESTGDGNPVVKFLCGVKQAVHMERWTVRAQGGVLLHRKQLPLQLAWAMSIHKSQGMTLDCLEISLASVFECGQAYVALSRATSLEGLRVLGFNSGCVRANLHVVKFYKQLRNEKLLSQRSLDGYF